MTAVAVVLAGAAAWLVIRPPPVVAAGSRAGRAPGWPPTVVSVAGVAGLAAVVVGPVAAVAVAALMAARTLVRARERRRTAAEAGSQVLDACELMSAELAAGQPPGHALRRAAEAWTHLLPVAEAAELGGDVPLALRRAAAEPGASDLRAVAGAWVLAHRTGAGLAEALDRVVSGIRADRALRRVVESELASARATARLVAGLPLVVLLLGNGGGGSAVEFLLGSPLGLACLAAGLTLGFAGLWWIERIAAQVTR
ncbi:type II secretion system F family protein [Nocardioides sp.]|uniref:type II secretion system F family protein n=1 Tax=Nocardioides sp. TaxID=35761 RepID=UPI002ED03B8F